MRGEWIEMLHRTRAHLQKLSLPMRGEWIEIAHKIGPLKAPVTSLPMRGEWIEIWLVVVLQAVNFGLSPCGESGLKYRAGVGLIPARRLSPCGESGLKLVICLCASAASGLSPCGESGLK